MDLQDKVVFVTGAGGGIGAVIATTFAAAGARLLLTDVRAAELEEAADRARAAGAEVVAAPGDLTDPETVNGLVALAEERFGGLDAAVNGAAFYPPDSELTELDEQLARRVVEVDFWGVFHCMRAQIPALRRRGGGSIVNLSSGAGILGYPRNGIYCAAKHAVVGIGRSAAIDHAPERIRINTICPGMIETPPLTAYLQTAEDARARATALHPIGRLGAPEEVADAALWLCSDRSTFVTGTELPVDGGFATW